MACPSANMPSDRQALAEQAAAAAIEDVGAVFLDMDAVFAGIALPSSPWTVQVVKERG